MFMDAFCCVCMCAVSYDDQEMTLNWHKKDPVVIADTIEIPSYTLTDSVWFTRSEIFTTGKKTKAL